MLFDLQRLFTVFIFVREGRLVLVPHRGVIVQVVDALAVGPLPGTVHLQFHLFIVVLELQSGDQVLSLKVPLGEIVHGLRVALLVPLPPHVARRRQCHAAKHQRHPQADSQTKGSQAQPVLRPLAHVRAGGRCHLCQLTLRAAVVFRADAGRLLFPAVGGDAGAAVEAGPRGAEVRRPVAVATRETRRAGAGVVVDAVDAGGAIGAGASGALVDVDLAAGTSEAREAAALWAAASHHAVASCRGQEKERKEEGKSRGKKKKKRRCEHKDQFPMLFPSVQIFCGLTVAALHRCTSIHLFLAVGPSVARRALAHVGTPTVRFSALATKKAGGVCTRVHLVFALRPGKTPRTLALIAALQVLRNANERKTYRVYRKALLSDVLFYCILSAAALTNPHYPLFEFYLQSALCELGHLLT